MINNIYPHIFNNEYLNISPKNLDNIMIFNDKKELLLEESNCRISFPKFEELNSNLELIYLFSIDNINYFLDNTGLVNEFENYKYQNISITRKAKPRYLSFAAITAYQLNNWYSKNKYCGNCGNKMHHGEKSRTMICPNCYDTRYPFLAPAVIVGIINRDKLLLTKYANSNHKRFALVAGYAEIGESIEDTVRREVMEEVGLKVRNIRYYKSQPWGIVDDLLAGFFCEVDGSRDIRMDEKELKEALWVEREEVELQPDDFSLTNEMMRMFKENRL